MPDAIWDEAARHCDEKALAALVVEIALINAFNRLNAATRRVVGAWGEADRLADMRRGWFRGGASDPQNVSVRTHEVDEGPKLRRDEAAAGIIEVERFVGGTERFQHLDQRA